MVNLSYPILSTFKLHLISCSLFVTFKPIGSFIDLFLSSADEIFGKGEPGESELQKLPGVGKKK